MNILSRATDRGNTVRMLKRHTAIKKCCAALWVYFDLVSLAHELIFIMESTGNRVASACLHRHDEDMK